MNGALPLTHPAFAPRVTVFDHVTCWMCNGAGTIGVIDAGNEREVRCSVCGGKRTITVERTL